MSVLAGTWDIGFFQTDASYKEDYGLYGQPRIDLFCDFFDASIIIIIISVVAHCL